MSRSTKYKTDQLVEDEIIKLLAAKCESAKKLRKNYLVESKLNSDMYEKYEFYLTKAEQVDMHHCYERRIKIRIIESYL
jgi:hypothetical protein